MTRRARWVLLLAASVLTPLGAAMAAPPETTPPTSAPIVTSPQLFTDDDLLLLAVSSGDLPLSDSFEAYSSQAGVFLPIGALARLIDVDITVDPQRQRAEGWVVSPQRTIRIDIPSRQLVLAGTESRLADADAAFKDGEIYLRASLIEKILPIRITADVPGLLLTLTPTERLPFQERLERDRLRSQLAAGGSPEAPPLEIATPYRLFTPPSVDINLTAGAGNHDPTQSGSYDLRAAGDLGGAGAELFAGSDADFRLDSIRVLLSRKDPYGKSAGPFGATHSSIGDTYTPNLTLGARSTSGRGLAITSVPLEQASVFDKIDLRGELPLGYQVELYVNEVLRGSQAQPVQGRYEFQGVSLLYGLNVIRLVFYGPRGERREEVRRINVGGGELAAGQTVFAFGAVQEGLAVFDVGQGGETASPGQGKWRVTGSVAHGLTGSATLVASFAQYTPFVNDTRQMGSLGLVTSVAGASVQADAAYDSKGGAALALGAAGRYRATSIVARHSEYRNGFVDEVQSAGASSIPLRRNTNISIDTVLGVLRRDLPTSLQLVRDEFADGVQDIRATARVSQTVGRYLLSNGLQYQHRSGGSAPGFDRLDGAVDLTGVVDGVWQVRGGAVYTVVPRLKLQSAGVTADRNIGVRTAVHLGLSHAFGVNQSTLEAGQTWRFDPADVSLVSSFTTKTNDFRIGIQLSVGFGYDPWRSRYAMIGPNAAAGGAMAVDAFLDTNGDGVREPGEKPLPGLLVQGGRKPVPTDANGHALVTGLGDGAAAVAQIDLSSLDDPYLTPAAPAVKIVPRAGRIAAVPYPVTVSGEVELEAKFQRAGEATRGISALHVELVAADGHVAASGSSEYDGSLLFDGLRPGNYAVRIEAGQAERLKLALVTPVTVKIAPGGGFAGRVQLLVTARPGLTHGGD